MVLGVCVTKWKQCENSRKSRLMKHHNMPVCAPGGVGVGVGGGEEMAHCVYVIQLYLYLYLWTELKSKETGCLLTCLNGAVGVLPVSCNLHAGQRAGHQSLSDCVPPCPALPPTHPPTHLPPPQVE